MKKHILFGVFDWGLGHATRAKPLIAALLDKGHAVDIISTGRALAVLDEHFSTACTYHDVPSIVSPYTKSENFVWNFALSTPRMLASLKKARALSKKIIRENAYDLVISDCRYDVYDQPKNSFLINHQLRFAAPSGTETFLEAWLAYRMEKFGRIIVPDYPSPKFNLTGKLSHKLTFIPQKRIAYIGHLSHLRRLERDRDIDYFITLTGPEPQRSILEEKIFRQAEALDGDIVIAGGNPDRAKPKLSGRISYFPYLNTAEMEDYLNRARFFISRSGYTSMMELAEVGLSRALLIPTPGQTEQEYLGDYYEKRSFFHHVHQKDLDLAHDVRKAKGFDGFKPPWDTAQSIRYFLEAIGLA